MKLFDNKFFTSVKKNLHLIILYTIVAIIASVSAVYCQLTFLFDDIENHDVFYKFGIYTPIPVAIILLSILFYRRDLYEEELHELNRSLEERVKEEVKKNVVNEKHLMKQSKMAALGEMMDAIAHQWKQPLNVINIKASALELHNNSNTLTNKLVSDISYEIMVQISHLVETTDQFRKFFRVDVKKEHIVIENIIEEVIELEKSLLIKNSIDIIPMQNTEHDYHLIESEFKHVFINLINNTIDAFNENFIEERVIKFEVNQDDKYLYIRVIDNAGGIPEEVIQNVFKANFTTKKEGKGTGIGLYMTTNILDKIAGTIEVENTEFELNNKIVTGAMFTIKLPLEN